MRIPSGSPMAFRIPNPPAAAEADQASSERGGHEPPAGDGATRRPKADSNSEIARGYRCRLFPYGLRGRNDSRLQAGTEGVEFPRIDDGAS